MGVAGLGAIPARAVQAAFVPSLAKGTYESLKEAEKLSKDPNATTQDVSRAVSSAVGQGLGAVAGYRGALDSGAGAYLPSKTEVGSAGLGGPSSRMKESMKAIEEGLEEKPTSPVTQFPTSEKGFYSQLQKVLHEKMPNNASVDQIRAIIDPSKGSGVKPDELKWSNLEGFLEGKKSVTKEEVLDYLKNEGAVKFEEVTQGDWGKAREKIYQAHDRGVLHSDMVNYEGGISFMPSKLDEAHAKAIESGDTEEAHRMVDEVARKAGLHHGWHGSPEKGIKEMNPEYLGLNTGAKSAIKGFFHSNKREVADSYRRLEEQGISHIPEEKLDGVIRQLKKDLEYLKSIPEENLYDYKAWELVSENTFNNVNLRDYYPDEAIPKIEERLDQLTNANYGQLYENYLQYDNPYIIEANGKRADQIRLSEQIEDALAEGHDAVIVKDVLDSLHFGTDRSTVTIVFDPNQIKSGAPATYDDQGKLIPLSQRFNESY